MSRKKEMAKDERIKKEESRLRAIYRNIDEDNKAIIDGLIPRTAYMRITLEDWEKDIDENGITEQFTQSERTAPYERERPIIRLYNTMNKNYQSVIKQLSDLVPKYEKADESDGFDDFVNGRDDL